MADDDKSRLLPVPLNLGGRPTSYGDDVLGSASACVPARLKSSL